MTRQYISQIDRGNNGLSRIVDGVDGRSGRRFVDSLPINAFEMPFALVVVAQQLRETCNLRGYVASNSSFDTETTTEERESCVLMKQRDDARRIHTCVCVLCQRTWRERGGEMTFLPNRTYDPRSKVSSIVYVLWLVDITWCYLHGNVFWSSRTPSGQTWCFSTDRPYGQWQKERITTKTRSFPSLTL